MRIAMIGTGYVGLVSGACFADFGHRVMCVDKDEARSTGLNAGVMPIWEPGLEGFVKANAERGRLTFTTDLPGAVENAEAVFIAVGTPARRGDGHADLTFVFEAVRELAKVHPAGDGRRHQVDRSGRHRRPIEEILRGGRRRPTSRSRPTRSSCAKAPRSPISSIPTGSSSAPRTTHAEDVLKEIYRPLFLNRAPILFTGRRTAELTKYAANAFLAVKISFINEIADLCEAVDADVQDVARGIGLDNRIGPKFLHAGPGYGGSCFPKDTLALLQTADKFGVDQRIVRTTVEVNDDRKAGMVERVERAVGGDLKGKRVGVLGLAFKPNTDDMREAPSIPLIEALVERGGGSQRVRPGRARAGREDLLRHRVRAPTPKRPRTGRTRSSSSPSGTSSARSTSERIADSLRGKVLVDLRNVYDREDAEAAGLAYYGVGRGTLERA